MEMALSEAIQERTEMTTSDNSVQPLLTEREVARLTGMSVASVRKWRLLGQGPQYLKISTSVRYRPHAVAAWLESRPTGGGRKEAL